MPLFAASDVTKRFPRTGVLANDRVSISLEAGEIRAVVGENGAGKSTFARIAAGLVAPDSGEIRVRGIRLRPGSVRDSEAAGIGFVPQHSLLARSLTVAESIALGREPRRLGLFLNRDRADYEAAMMIERFGFRIDPGAPVSSLSPSERRQAEIARAMARGGEILVLDEPTSIMSESEAEGLFALLRRLAAAGKGILFITHRLSEVKRFASTITVLREGRAAAHLDAASVDEARIAALMARRPATRCALPPRAGGRAGSGMKAVLELRGLVLAPGASPLDLEIGAGEVVGVAALAGNGLDSLEDLASGYREPLTGEVRLQGRSLEGRLFRELRSSGFSYVPADREARGLCLLSSVADNLLVLRRRDFGFLQWAGSGERIAAASADAGLFGLKASPRSLASDLSGGNRQRLLLSRELRAAPVAAVLSEPFQGLDIAAQEETAERIVGAARAGSAILVLSSSVDELLPIADRIAVLYRGELVGETENRGAACADRLLALMTGLGRKGAA